MKKSLFILLSGLMIGSLGLSASPFPAKVMKWTQADKDQQRRAGAELLRQLEKAVKEKTTTFNIPKGVYRFHDLQLPHQPTHIFLKGVENLTIEGNDSWFYFDRQASAFLFSNCANVTLKNLNIDYDPLPYVQGTVVSCDDASRPRTFTFRPDPGYTMPELLVKDSVDWRTSINGNCRIMLWDKQTGLVKADQHGMDIINGKNSVQKLADGTYKIATWVWWGRSLKDAGVETGAPVTLWRRAGRAIRMEICGKVVLENVDIYASGFVGYVGYFGEGPCIFRNCDLKRRPGTDRLVGGNADGFNVRGTLKGALIENCSVEAIGDDAVNLHGVYNKVFEQQSPTELIVARTYDSEGPNPVWHFISGEPWTDSNRPQSKNLKTWAYLGKSNVLQKTALMYTIPESRKLHKWAAAARYTPGKAYPAFKVTLAEPMTLDSNSVFWSENAVVKGSVIRNNNFSNIVARGIRLQTTDAVVENNKVSHTTGPALTLAGQPGYWGEATNCQNIVIRNNLFQESGSCGGNAAVVMKVEGDPEKAEPIANIVFENNRIINPRGSGIELVGCENVTIIHNTISGLKSRPYMTDYNPDHYLDPQTYGQGVVEGPSLKKVKLAGNKILPATH
jgi:parallel beta-helix repeat protein